MNWFLKRREPDINIGKCDLCSNAAVYLYTRGNESWKRCPTHAGTVRDWDDLTINDPKNGPYERRDA